jgi:hypothetical protein
MQLPPLFAALQSKTSAQEYSVQFVPAQPEGRVKKYALGGKVGKSGERRVRKTKEGKKGKGG